MKFPQFSIRSTLLIVISVLNMLLAILIGTDVWRSWENLKQTRNLSYQSATVNLLYNTEKYLSIERGLLMAVLNTPPELTASLQVKLWESREMANARLSMALDRIDRSENPQLSETVALIEREHKELKNLRNQLDTILAPGPEAVRPPSSDLIFELMTTMITDIQVLIQIINQPLLDINTRVSQQLVFKHFIWEITEYAGREYAQIGRLIAENQIPSPKLKQNLITWKDRTEYAWEISTFFAKSSGLETSMAPQLEEARTHYFMTFDQIKEMFYGTGPGLIEPPYPISIELWLEMASQAIDTLTRLKDMALEETQNYIEMLEKDARREIAFNLFLVFCALGVSLYSWWVIKQRVVRPVNDMADSLYKHAHGSIPSPTENTLAEKDEIEKLALVLEVFQENTRILEQTAHELQQQKNYLRAIFDTNLDAIITFNEKGEITEWNKQAENIFGWSRSEALKKGITDIIIPKDSRQFDLEGTDWLFKNGSSPVLNKRTELNAVNRKGSIFHIAMAVTNTRFNGRHSFTAFISDISGRKQAEARLLEYTEQLKRSNQELDDFVYVVSHDLKEPLRGIYSYSQFLQEDYEDKLDEEGVNKLETLKKLSHRMEELIDRLLKYSRLGRAELAFKKMDLNAVLKETLELMEPLTNTEDVTVTINDLPVIRCDRARVSEIFRNLITNAIKYNDSDQKKVEVGYLTDHPEYPGKNVFFVKDNGIGIPEKHRDIIFKMFKRLHARDAYGGGTGSGLTIVKKIIDRHNGKIWITSNEMNGTTFYFTLEACL